jgi:hypothetical protein
MEKINILGILLLISAVASGQDYKPSDFHGAMKLEDHKIIYFTSLTNPTDGTNIAFYTQKPGAEQYLKQQGRRLLSFGLIGSIEILPYTDAEAAEIRGVCGRCPLQKAKLVLWKPDPSIPETVYLDFKFFAWKSSTMKGFPDQYEMEVRLVDEITFNPEK